MIGVLGQKCRTSGYHWKTSQCVMALSLRAKRHGMSYLVHDVLERVGAVNCEANEEKIGFGVRQGTKSVVFLLSCCVPQGEFYGFAGGFVLFDGEIVFEDGRHVFLGLIG